MRAKQNRYVILDTLKLQVLCTWINIIDIGLVGALQWLWTKIKDAANNSDTP
jgi:hypothetical protein